MRIYVAGPMRGYKDFNFPAFHYATGLIRADGHEVFSPAERDLLAGFDPSGMIGSDKDLARSGFSLRDALGADLEWITSKAQALVVLPGWQESSGTKAEVATAEALRLPIWEFGPFVLYGDLAPTVGGNYRNG